MSWYRFTLVANPDAVGTNTTSTDVPQPTILRVIEDDSGELSKPIVKVQTLLGKDISLIPSKTEPWFEAYDAGVNKLYGALHHPDGMVQPFTTPPIKSCTTAKGDTYYTSLLMARNHDAGETQRASEGFGVLVSRLIEDSYSAPEPTAGETLGKKVEITLAPDGDAARSRMFMDAAPPKKHLLN